MHARVKKLNPHANTPAIGSRNLTDPKTLQTIWGTYMKLVIKYQISAINMLLKRRNIPNEFGDLMHARVKKLNPHANTPAIYINQSKSRILI
jgi:hypothetical protein